MKGAYCHYVKRVIHSYDHLVHSSVCVGVTKHMLCVTLQRRVTSLYLFRGLLHGGRGGIEMESTGQGHR